MGESDQHNLTQRTFPHRFMIGMCVGLAAGLALTVTAALLLNRLSINVRVLVEPAQVTSALFTKSTPPPGQPLRYSVDLHKVIDGDTIRVMWEGTSTSVRLLGIDAPEREQPGYKEARDFLLNRIGKKKVTLEFPDGQVKRDVYNRLLAILYVDDDNICDELIKADYAIPYR